MRRRPMNSDDRHNLVWLGAFMLVLVVGWYALSYFEARAFNRVAGQDVSAFDAMFLRLRVEADADD